MKAFIIFNICLSGLCTLLAFASACMTDKPNKVEFTRGFYVFRTVWHLAITLWAAWVLTKGVGL